MPQQAKPTLRRLRLRPGTHHLRLRVQSCIDLILALDKRLGEGTIKPEIIQQFQRLKEHIPYVNDELVDERDIDRIEIATNHLMAAIGNALDKDQMGPIHEGHLH
jgi:hypothetical protein